MTGMPAPVSIESSTPMGGLFVAPAGRSSMITDAVAVVPLPSTIVYSKESTPT